METDWHNPSMLISCYQGMGDREQLHRVARITIERVEKAVSKDPSNAPALSTGASALAILGEDDRARDWIDRALLLAPDDIMMRYNLACALIPDPKNRDRAIEMIAPYFEGVVSTTQIKHVDADPDLDPIRDDPRMKKMLAAAKQRLGIAEASTWPRFS